MKTEAKVAVPPLSNSVVEVAIYEEEGENTNSGRKMRKFCEDCPEKSKVDEEVSKTKPVLEDESESSRVSSVFNSGDLKSPTESPGGDLLLKNADQGSPTISLKALRKTKHKKSGQEVAQIMSEPESEKPDNVFIWRIDDDPPIATNGLVHSG